MTNEDSPRSSLTQVAFALALAFVTILLLAWAVDCILVFRVWPEGIDGLRSVLTTDLARAVDLEGRQGGAPSAVTGTANTLYALVFRITGMHDMGLRFADGAALSVPDTIVRNTYLANREAIGVAMIGTQLLGVRLASLALMAPLLLLIYVVAAADGLTQRTIRRASGGRESASLYHRAKHLQVAALGMGVLTMLLWPAPINCLLAGAPLAALVGILARLQWVYYKKHL